MRKEMMRYISIMSYIFAAACGKTATSHNENKKNYEINNDIVEMASKGSSKDIEYILKFYERCPENFTKLYCSDMLDKWADIGAEYGQLGSMTIVINRDIGSDKCYKLRKVKIYIDKVRYLSSRYNTGISYSWDNELSVVTKRLKSHC